MQTKLIGVIVLQFHDAGEDRILVQSAIGDDMLKTEYLNKGAAFLSGIAAQNDSNGFMEALDEIRDLCFTGKITKTFTGD